MRSGRVSIRVCSKHIRYCTRPIGSASRAGAIFPND
jgi:hypothetical protein